MTLSKKTTQFLKAALNEDIGRGDKTSQLLVPSNARGKAVVISRQKGVFCGRAVAGFLARQVDRRLKVKWKCRDGQAFSRNQKVIEIGGSLPSILKLERTLLNFVGHLSGVSTLTSQFVAKTKRYGVDILDTRKTTPLWRELEKDAVRKGGGKNHRFGLDDEIFVKENHRGHQSLQKLKKYPRKFVIEVRSQKELAEALMLKPRVILLDNFAPAKLKKAIRYARQKDKKVKLESSGGITLANVTSHAKSGIDQISIGALTHSIPNVNFSMIVSHVTV